MDDNTFECPNCGSRIYPEQTLCPRCGQNMYPEDEENNISAKEVDKSGWGSLLGALLIGWMIASGITIIIHFTLSGFISPSTLGGLGVFILFTASLLGSLVGGYVSAGSVKRYSTILGGFIGLMSLPIAALLTTRWVKVTLDLLLSPMFLLACLMVVLAGIVGGWLNQGFSQNTDWKEKWRVRGWEDLLYQDLLRKVRFNGSTADRLIDYERQQEPQATRLKLIQSAIERWERDNR